MPKPIIKMKIEDLFLICEIICIKSLTRYKIKLYLVTHLINSLLRRIKWYEMRTIPEIQDIRSLSNGDQYNGSLLAFPAK